MERLRIAICDDEQRLRRDLRHLIQVTLDLKGAVYKIEEYSSGEALLEGVTAGNAGPATRGGKDGRAGTGRSGGNGKAAGNAGFAGIAAGGGPQILFLDIEMPGIDGMETARRLRALGSKAVIIFVTAYPDFVFQGYEVQAFHYILKPYQPEKIRQVLGRALEEARLTETQYYIVEQKSGTLRLPLDQVICFKSDRRSVEALLAGSGDVASDSLGIGSDSASANGSSATADGSDSVPDSARAGTGGTGSGETVTFYGKLDEVEAALPAYYQRVHNRYLVNMHFVTKVEASSCMAGGREIPVSRAYKQNLAVAFAKMMLK